MFEAEDPLEADVPPQADDLPQADAMAQAVSDVGTGEAEDETLSAGDIDAAVPEGGELSLGEDEAPAEAEPGKNIPEPGESLVPSTVEAVVTYRFIVGEEVVATQTAQDGDEVIRPEDPAAPKGMVFAGWFYMDGEPVFDGDEPVIAVTDPLIPEIAVFARFIDASAEEEETPSEEEETPSEVAADTPVGTPEMASGDTTDATDDTDATDGEAAEQAADGEAAELDDPAKASLSEGGGAEAPAEAVPFDQSVNYNGVVITVKADAGIFPASATLSVMRVLLYEQTQADAAVDEVRDEDQNVAARYTFDISILDEDGNELQPAEGHSVEVNFALAEAGDENLETNVYHITEDMAAEKLDTEATDEAVTAVTDGFSLYTVEFTYNDLTYVLPGDSSVALSEILDAVGLKGAAEAVSVSASELFSVETNAAGA